MGSIDNHSPNQRNRKGNKLYFCSEFFLKRESALEEEEHSEWSMDFGAEPIYD